MFNARVNVIKKIAGLFALLAFAMNVSAQELTCDSKEEQAGEIQKAEQTNKDGVKFKAGKAWLVKDGQVTALDKEMTLGNGDRKSVV